MFRVTTSDETVPWTFEGVDDADNIPKPWFDVPMHASHHLRIMPTALASIQTGESPRTFLTRKQGVVRYGLLFGSVPDRLALSPSTSTSTNIRTDRSRRPHMYPILQLALDCVSGLGGKLVGGQLTYWRWIGCHALTGLRETTDCLRRSATVMTGKCRLPRFSCGAKTGPCG